VHEVADHHDAAALAGISRSSKRYGRVGDMPERADVIFDRGLDAFGTVVEQLQPRDWDLLSPCEGWTALDVLGHLGSSIQMGIDVLAGKQPTWPDVRAPPISSAPIWLPRPTGIPPRREPGLR